MGKKVFYFRKEIFLPVKNLSGRFYILLLKTLSGKEITKRSARFLTCVEGVVICAYFALATRVRTTAATPNTNA